MNFWHTSVIKQSKNKKNCWGNWQPPPHFYILLKSQALILRAKFPVQDFSSENTSWESILAQQLETGPAGELWLDIFDGLWNEQCCILEWAWNEGANISECSARTGQEQQKPRRKIQRLQPIFTFMLLNKTWTSSVFLPWRSYRGSESLLPWSPVFAVIIPTVVSLITLTITQR